MRRNQQENFKHKVGKNQEPTKIIVCAKRQRGEKGYKSRRENGIASTAEEATRSQRPRTLYRLTEKICNERPKQSTAVLDKKGKLVGGKDKVQARWTENFKDILNRGELANPYNN